MKRTVSAVILSIVLILASLTAALAQAVPVAPDPAEGKLMAVVVNSRGAKVYQNVYREDADFAAPVETVPEGEELEIRTMGIGWCRLQRDNKDELYYVRTSDLSFSSTDFGSQVAIVFLKRSNKMPLHREASAKSKKIVDIPDGSYVAVLERGDAFSLVRYIRESGSKLTVYEGYLQNANLSFRVAWPGEVRQGYLRDPKKPERRTTVNLRSADSKKGKKVKVLATRQYVTVLQVKDNGWAEIETDKGLHGYLLAEWLELTEPAAEQPAAEEPAATAPPAEEEQAAAEEEVPEEADYADDDEEAVEADDEELAPEWEE